MDKNKTKNQGQTNTQDSQGDGHGFSSTYEEQNKTQMDQNDQNMGDQNKSAEWETTEAGNDQ